MTMGQLCTGSSYHYRSVASHPTKIACRESLRQWFMQICGVLLWLSCALWWKKICVQSTDKRHIRQEEKTCTCTVLEIVECTWARWAQQSRKLSSHLKPMRCSSSARLYYPSAERVRDWKIEEMITVSTYKINMGKINLCAVRDQVIKTVIYACYAIAHSKSNFFSHASSLNIESFTH